MYWLDPILDEIEKTYPRDKIIISSGISPSASYHIGHLREIISADLISWGLRKRGRDTEHLHIVDNFDPLRKRYDFLPLSYEQYVGWPVCLVPDPDGCHTSYADHFFSIFYKYVEKLGIEVQVVRSYEDLYKTGKMAPYIEKVADRAGQIRQVFKDVVNRDLPEGWMPFSLLSDNQSFQEWSFVGIDKAAKTITYSDQSGHQGSLGYGDGRVKLNWRLDWPARWDLLNIMVEPHGHQEHGAAGGSFETGKIFIKEIFGSIGPIAGFQYGHIHLLGDNIKMSSSKGNIITPEQAFAIMPPDMIRYIYARYPGKKRIDFDPGLGLFRLMDEFSEVDRAIRGSQAHEFAPAYGYAVDGQKTAGMSSIAFNHLVTVFQTARGDRQEIDRILSRSGYQKEVLEQKTAIDGELIYIGNWLKDWAPEEVKFSLQETTPELDWSSSQRQLLMELAQQITNTADKKDALWYHEQIHNLRASLDLTPDEAFAAIYQALLAKPSGPRAGWFLSSLEPEWLAERFQQCGRAKE